MQKSLWRKTMAKKKEPDNLAKDAAAALAAGMSYGRWKAMNPNTVRAEPESDEIPDGWKLCKHCGKQFKPRKGTRQFYCEPWCQKEAHRERDRKRKRKQAEKKTAEQEGAENG
jgi:hypothetical protein